MFCDDINGIVVHIGHLRSFIGFVGDEIPSYQTDSAFYHNKNDPISFLLMDDFSPQMDISNGVIHQILSNKRINNIGHYSHFVSRLASKINIDLSEVALILTTNLQNGFQEGS